MLRDVEAGIMGVNVLSSRGNWHWQVLLPSFASAIIAPSLQDWCSWIYLYLLLDLVLA